MPPSDEPVTLADLKDQLRVDHTDEDAFLAMKISTARRHIENLTGLTLARATFEVALDAFPRAEIEIPKNPLVSVESIRFIAPGGAELTVAPNLYVVDTVSERGWIVPVEAWPQTMRLINAVRVRFVAGYDEAPETLREAVLQLAAWWYENREAATEAPHQSIPFGVQELVNEHREWTF